MALRYDHRVSTARVHRDENDHGLYEKHLYTDFGDPTVEKCTVRPALMLQAGLAFAIRLREPAILWPAGPASHASTPEKIHMIPSEAPLPVTRLGKAAGLPPRDLCLFWLIPLTRKNKHLLYPNVPLSNCLKFAARIDFRK